VSSELPGRQPFGVAFSLQPKGIVHAPLPPGAGEPLPVTRLGMAVLEVFPTFLEETLALQPGTPLWVLTYQPRADSPPTAAWETLPSLGDMLADPTIHGRHPLGVDQVTLLETTGLLLRVEGLEVEDGTPILDIQPIKERTSMGRPRHGATPRSPEEPA